METPPPTTNATTATPAQLVVEPGQPPYLRQTVMLEHRWRLQKSCRYRHDEVHYKCRPLSKNWQAE